MSEKITASLKILNVFGLKNNFALHPNDGADLGLLGYNTKVQMIINGERFEGEILLKNECKPGIVEMSKKMYTRLGSPDHIKLALKGEILLFKF